MLHTTNPVSKLNKSQQYRVAYNLPVLFKAPRRIPLVLMMAHLALYASLDYRCDSTSALQTIVREPWPITYYLKALSDEIGEPSKKHLDRYLEPFVVSITDRSAWPAIIGGLKGLDGLDKKNISYESLNDHEVQKIYMTYRSEYPVKSVTQ